MRDFAARQHEVVVAPERLALAGLLVVPGGPGGLVVFAHGSGSSGKSARNRFVAERLQVAGHATLLFDLLSDAEASAHADDFDAELLARSGDDEVVVLPTAAAFEHPERVGERAEAYFAELGARARSLPVLHRTEAEDPAVAKVVRSARFVYLADGSPLHLRSVLKESALFEALLAAYQGGAVIAASGAGATLLCDPMVDPRGGAYTVGLGVVKNLAVFPYHGTAAAHLRERSIDLLPRNAVLAGIDEATALVKGPDGWSVGGVGAVTLYAADTTTIYSAGDTPAGLPD